MKLNKITNGLRKFIVIRFGIIALIAGIIFVGVSIFVISKTKGVNFIETDATVTNVYLYDVENDFTLVDAKFMANDVQYPIISCNISGNRDVGYVFLIRYNEENPEQFQIGDSSKIVYVFLAIGIVISLTGIIVFVKGITMRTNEFSYFDQVDYSNISEEMKDEVLNNDEEIEEFYYHFYGKLNQSYILETTERIPVYKQDCTHYNLFKGYDFKFSNLRALTTKNYHIGNTITISSGMEPFSIPIKSTFKMNDKEVFKIISEMGYSIDSKIEFPKLNFDVYRYGIKVAELINSGANVCKANKNYGKLGEMPTQGVYKIKCKESDLDGVCLVAFAVSRIEFFY